MALTVVVRSGDLATPAEITLDAPRVVIGRSEGCEIELPDPSVSHRHASIRQRGTEYVILDEGSTNGTFVAKVRLSPQAPRLLKSGDLIRVGRVWLEVRIAQVPVTQNQKLVTREIALGLVASALTADGRPANAVVRVVSGPDAGASLTLTDAERTYVVGRGPGLDLSLTDDGLSRRHLEIARRGPHLSVRDLRSKNGVELDGVRLEPDKETTWPLAATLLLGDSELRYEDPVRAALDEIARASDERIPDRETIAAPVGVAVDAASTRNSEVAPPTSKKKLSKAPPAPPSPGRPGVGWADVLVAVLALSVLALSLFGLWLLFRA
jgi:pSer/pThr/pTyr-binding forkhead associated (FHA) protein